MRKSIICVFVAVFILLAAVISGCTDKKNNETESTVSTDNIDVVIEPTQVKIQPTPESTPGQGFSEPRFNIIGFVTLDSSPMSVNLEYSINLVIQSVTRDPVAFDSIEVKYYDQSLSMSSVLSLGHVVLEYGQAVNPSTKTYGLVGMQNKVENAGKKTIVMYIQPKNGNENVGGEYSATLPPLSYMVENNNMPFQIQFALDNDPLYNK